MRSTSHSMQQLKSLIVTALIAPVVIMVGDCRGADCTVTTVNKIPINDLGTGLYLNQYQGGLYPGGSNAVPVRHAAAGTTMAQNIQPLNAQGQPSATGKYVFVSIGMSNTTQEFSRFMQIAASNPQVNHTRMVIVDGAAGGQTAATWDQPTDANYDRVRDQKLAPLGLTEAQVQAAWVKLANPGPNSALPNANADANTMFGQLGNVMRALKVRYPNIKVVFLSSRIYAGYATGVSSLNPEPYSYESGFSCKWLIEAQINQMAGGGIHPTAGDLNYNTVAPWLAWGPYLWADGLTPRSDGLTWLCSDLVTDGTHPSDAGRLKVANMLLNFMLNSPFSSGWFRGNAGDVNGDNHATTDDLLAVINAWGACPQPCPPTDACAADLAPPQGNCAVNVDDLLMVINNWG